MKHLCVFALVMFMCAACNKDDNKPSSSAKDPNTAEPAFIDRFSSTAGHLQVRTATNNLPAANGKTSK